MRFKGGQHAGKTYEEVFLKKPDFARWYAREFGDTPAAAEFRELAKKFNEKPFTARCHGCINVATRASAYRGTPSLYFWCDSCKAADAGAVGDKLVIVRTIKEALDHVHDTASGKRVYMRAIVRELAEAKGLPTRVGEKQAVGFFASSG
jgi:hypothetical protein